MLKFVVALVSLAAVGACCPTTAVVAPEAPVVTPDGTVALGGACGPSIGECAADGYCAFADDNACGVIGAGICTARPRGCFKDCPGVCGCDGVRHCNTCVAQARGVSVRHAGACEDGPRRPEGLPLDGPAITP